MVRVRRRKMGAEALLKKEVAVAEAPIVVGLQPSALVDHVARVDWSLLHQISGEHGGSIPVLLLLTHPSSQIFFLFISSLSLLTFFAFIITFTRWVLTIFSFSMVSFSKHSLFVLNYSVYGSNVVILHNMTWVLNCLVKSVS